MREREKKKKKKKNNTKRNFHARVPLLRNIYAEPRNPFTAPLMRPDWPSRGIPATTTL